jgi:glucose-1-phosphate adenylyltransferase
MTRDSLALVLAGGRGSRLHELTDWRAKPALYFGGKYRIIDFPLSNCINSGIRRIGVLTQYKAHSLIRHLVRGWGFFKNELGEFVDVLPASQRHSEAWYQGTADAIYQNLDIIRAQRPKYVLVLSGDHVYKMDYGLMLAEHVASGAEMTVSCLEVPVEEAAGAFGVMKVDETNRVIGFEEKPANPSTIPGSDNLTLASMGNYVFNTDFLFKVLEVDAKTEGSSRDFGNDIIPSIIESHKVHAFPFRDEQTGDRAYWRDVGTLDSFWTANMELIQTVPPLNMYDEDWPLWTYQEQLPPAKFVFDEETRCGYATESMVSGGCIISGARVRHSVLFSNVLIEEQSEVSHSVILPDAHIGRNVKLNKVIVDRKVVLEDGFEAGFNHDQDRERGFRVTAQGVVLITRGMLGQEEGSA